MRAILVTGGAGFIGSNFVRMLIERGERVKLIVLDKLTYAGNLANIDDLLEAHPDRLVFVRGDICDPDIVEAMFTDHGVREIVHFAAESHVDRSILSSRPFIQANVVGTQMLLDISKARGIDKFVHVSTDEVYGSLPENRPEVKFTEATPMAPNSPYSASKASADCFVRAYYETHQLPTVITRCSNNYGPYQFPEKALPLFITNLMQGMKIPLYGDGLNVRDWLYVEDHCEGIWAVLNGGKPGEVYNIGGNNEMTNRKIVETILREMGKTWDEGVQMVKDRPGHDRRYAIDASKMKRELGWSPKHKFEQAIKSTIQWYRDNESRWRAIKSGEYLKYYEQQYAQR
jgi:dTDP-glucose 4,6-dehydratase